MSQLKEWDVLSKEEKRKLADEFIHFFQKERDETIGFIQAEDFIDFFMEHIFASAYNRWIEDAQKILWERFQDFQVDLEMLRH